MGRTRLDFKEERWGELYKEYPDLREQLDIRSDRSRKVHVHIPVCIGFKQSTKEIIERLDGDIRAIQAKGYDFTIYPTFNPANEKAQSEWSKQLDSFRKKYPDSELSLVESHRILPIENWRENERWVTAQARYQAISKDENTVVAIEQDQAKDVENFQKGHKDFPDVPAHVIRETVDYISFQNEEIESDEEDENRPVSILFYPNNLFHSMRRAGQYAKQMGYQPLVHIKQLYEKVHVKEAKNDFTVETLEVPVLKHLRSASKGSHSDDDVSSDPKSSNSDSEEEYVLRRSNSPSPMSSSGNSSPKSSSGNSSDDEGSFKDALFKALPKFTTNKKIDPKRLARVLKKVAEEKELDPDEIGAEVLSDERVSSPRAARFVAEMLTPDVPGSTKNIFIGLGGSHKRPNDSMPSCSPPTQVPIPKQFKKAENDVVKNQQLAPRGGLFSENGDRRIEDAMIQKATANSASTDSEPAHALNVRNNLG